MPDLMAWSRAGEPQGSRGERIAAAVADIALDPALRTDAAYRSARSMAETCDYNARYYDGLGGSVTDAIAAEHRERAAGWRAIMSLWGSNPPKDEKIELVERLAARG